MRKYQAIIGTNCYTDNDRWERSKRLYFIYCSSFWF